MSSYSGKYDVADYFEGCSDEELRNSDIYIGDNPVPLRIENQHDLAPYYPHLITIGSWCEGRASCWITERSFVDFSEEEHLGWKLRDFQRYWRRCKRNKKDYIEEEAIAKICWFEPTDVDREIAHRVAMYGNKATVEGLHDELHEFYRRELLEKMVELGWDEGKAKIWIWKDWTIVQNKE